MLLLGVLQAQAAGVPGVSRIAGYFAGGEITSGAQVTRVQKLAFPDETISTLATGLSSGRQGSMGTSNPDVAGYANGGQQSSGYVGVVDKFAFPSDARSTLGTGLSSASGDSFTMSNSGFAGYVAGGFPNRTTVDKFAWPSDSRSILGTGLQTARTAGAPVSNDGVAGYALSGTNTSNVDGRTTASDKFAFASDTRSTLSFPVATFSFAGVNYANNAGYTLGGNTGTRQSSIRKIAFATDSFSVLAATINVATTNIHGRENPNIAGYTGGGFSDSGLIDTINKLEFATESSSVFATGLAELNRNVAGFRN